MNLFVDGGGTPTVPTYFSYKCVEAAKVVSMNRFLLNNLAPELIPGQCSIYDSKGDSTNNIAEYAALFYGLKKFRKVYEYSPLTIFQDSQLIVRQVTGDYQCKQEHLAHWRKAVLMLWTPRTEIKWIPRDGIVDVLGH